MSMSLLLLSLISPASAQLAQCTRTTSCRNVSDIVWDCVATVVACVWVSVHPNIPQPPPPRASSGSGITRWVRYMLDETWALRSRIKLMLVALISPELIVGFAARQLAMAVTFSKEYDIPLPKGFFICMGGFVDEHGYPLVTRAQLDGAPEIRQALRDVPDAIIADRSKQDVFAKGVAFLQGIWFVLRFSARTHQHLGVTVLEVATLAFALINLVIWILWWSKPLQVTQPIVLRVGVGGGKPEFDETAHIDVEGEHAPAQAHENAAPALKRARTWKTHFAALVGIDYPSNVFNPRIQKTVPAFWYASLEDAQDTRGIETATLVEFFVAGAFGGLHAGVWRGQFPTLDERSLWRAASLVIAVVPSVLAIGMMLRSLPVPRLLTTMAIVYVPPRLVLLVLPFTTLRQLSASTFKQVDWNAYFPHWM
ncbi:hypothetical protein MKEN_00224700 [Mycena kentingensis (nom. inval.)]|nr:hypothetical protein MKEN_00224700 [Mycena kentingensis (nom. inval.)]